MFDLIFTIVDQPPVEDLGIELPIEAVRNLTECQRLLQDAVDAGTFMINVSVGKFLPDIFLPSVDPGQRRSCGQERHLHCSQDDQPD